MTRLLIATPCALGQLSLAYARSLAPSIAALTRAGVGFHYVPMESSCIVGARNLAVSMLLGDPSYTHLMFIDADMGWDPPEAPLRLLAADVDVVCAAYVTRGLQPRWTIGAQSLVPNAQGLIPLTHAPTGFLLARRGVFERLAAARPDLAVQFQTAPDPRSYLFFDARRTADGRGWLGDDYGFSETWTALGGKLYCYPDIAIYHTYTAWNGANLKVALERNGADSSGTPIPLA